MGRHNIRRIVHNRGPATATGGGTANTGISEAPPAVVDLVDEVRRMRSVTRAYRGLLVVSVALNVAQGILLWVVR